MDNTRIAKLIVKKLKGELDAYEAHELDAWISQSADNRMLYDQLTDPSTLQPDVMEYYQAKKRILEKIDARIGHPRVIPLWKKMIIAASIILVPGLGTFLLLFNKQVTQNEITTAKVINDDIQAPKISKAMITLADGRTVALSNIESGVLAVQGGVNITKTATGKVIYNGNSQEVAYNTFANPKGSTVIDVLLADGTQVWLNAGSSITYPVSFVGDEREVSITGEAYFEVAHNAAMPFKVNKGEMSVTVLGTHFNVNAYDDESDIKVTLLQGSVKVSSGSSAGVLKEGEQARITNDVKIVSGTDLEQVMAWKNGLFKMKGTDLATLIRQMARWYNVEVVYNNTAPMKSFGGTIDRSVSLQDLLKALEQYDIRSKIEKGKLIIQ